MRGFRQELKPGLRKRLAILVGASALLWLGAMLVAGDSGILAIVRAKSKLEVLGDEVRALEAENARLREEIRRLERDPAAVERLARERLMMARPGEEVILVPDPKAALAMRAVRREAAKPGGKAGAKRR